VNRLPSYNGPTPRTGEREGHEKDFRLRFLLHDTVRHDNEGGTVITPARWLIVSRIIVQDYMHRNFAENPLSNLHRNFALN
jgi:hypothetical protein